MKLAVLGLLLLQLATTSRSMQIEFGPQFGPLTFETIGDDNNKVYACLSYVFKFSGRGGVDADIVCRHRRSGLIEVDETICTFETKTYCEKLKHPVQCRLAPPTTVNDKQCQVFNLSMAEMKAAVNDGYYRGYGISSEWTHPLCLLRTMMGDS